MLRTCPHLLLRLAAGLALLTPVHAQQGAPHPSADACRVEVLRGSARVLTPPGGAEALARSQSTLVTGRGHLEVPVGAEVRVAWAGRASLRIWGPTALEWAARPAAAQRGPLPTTHSLDLEWTLFDVARMELEVRRGEHVLHLPGDWRVDLSGCALHLRGLPSGPIEARHHAGSPITLRWLGDPRRARPPQRLLPGSTLRIDRPAPAPADVAREQAPAWERHSWPWRELREPPTGRAGQPQATDSGAAALLHAPGRTNLVCAVQAHEDPERLRAELVEVESVRTTTRPSPEPSPEPSPGPSPGPSPAPSPEPGPQAEPHPTRPHPAERHDSRPAEPSFDPAHWRGLERHQLATPGGIVAERGGHIEVRVLTSGRTQVLVDALAADGAWCFGPRADWYLEPGAVVLFDHEGALKLGLGEVRRAPKHVERPQPDALR